MVNYMTSRTNAADTTGRFLVLFREDAIAEGMQILSDRISITSEDQSPILLDNLGVAVVDAKPTQFQSISRSLSLLSEEENPILMIEPERIVYALEGPVQSKTQLDVAPDYLEGYRDAVNQLVDRMLPDRSKQSEVAALDESVVTWGLQATKVVSSRYSGSGVKVAVLDTGFELNHPDFVGRSIVTKSFIEGEDVQDEHGHGTHCIGTACGARQPARNPRYGIAGRSEIYVGKVLSNAGSGSDGGILQGIEWAISNGCQVISMSLGAAARRGQTYSRVYEAVAQRALNRGTLIVAAAGNDSRRNLGATQPVGHPANCPSIMAVAALDSRLRVSSFSNQGLNLDGGQVDIAGPGVAVYSSWVMPDQYNTISGTSMATPHVAGIAALYAEATGDRGQALWNRLIRSATRLPIPAQDVGAGLVTAPNSFFS